VILKSSGKIGSNYRIRLSNTETGFISEDDVEMVAGSRVQPLYSVTSMSCGPSARADVVSIPYLEPVPYEIYPDPDGKRLVITLFGVESAATWVSHRTGCRMIDKLTWEQSTPETFRVYVNLKSEKIWGYDIRQAGRSLVLNVRYAPVFDLMGEKPLAGLKIAIEAGHGGSGTGAIGLSGLVEKDINLDLSFRLGELCAAMGAEVVQVRDSDRDMTLIEKRDIAIKAGADMLISIHANAGGRGYLSVAGTSTYWHNPFWAPLAQTIYDRLLETGLGEFGVVGSFNYTVTRASQMPAVLVEQAFMTHAEDEEKLADPDFRQQMAVKICEGMVDYLKYIIQ
jgi:N-acetylmuramoyl-L-alanine amidase